MKPCSNCKKARPPAGQRYCLACHAEYMRIWRSLRKHDLEQAFKKNDRKALKRLLGL